MERKRIRAGSDTKGDEDANIIWLVVTPFLRSCLSCRENRQVSDNRNPARKDEEEDQKSSVMTSRSPVRSIKVRMFKDAPDSNQFFH